jgi:dephospho-CoA kinase
MRGLSDQQIRGRLSAQWPLEKKIELADFVVWTEGSFELYRLQLERILKWII